MNRDRLTIVSEILQICGRERATKTSIVYGANLNFKMVRGYLETLTEKGLLREEEEYYVTTGKGEEFLRFFEAAKALLSEENEARLRTMLRNVVEVRSEQMRTTC